jgi:hypothetical protein
MHGLISEATRPEDFWINVRPRQTAVSKSPQLANMPLQIALNAKETADAIGIVAMPNNARGRCLDLPITLIRLPAVAFAKNASCELRHSISPREQMSTVFSWIFLCEL